MKCYVCGHELTKEEYEEGFCPYCSSAFFLFDLSGMSIFGF